MKIDLKIRFIIAIASIITARYIAIEISKFIEDNLILTSLIFYGLSFSIMLISVKTIRKIFV